MRGSWDLDRRLQLRYRRRQALLMAAAMLAGISLFFTATPTASALPSQFFGMTAHESAYDQSPDYGAPNWAAMQKAGVQRFRMQIKWQKVEAAGGWQQPYAWENTYDKYFAGAARHGIAILPYIYTRKDDNTAYYIVGGGNYTEWLQFVWTVVQRYGQAGTFWRNNLSLPQYPVDFWEVWNEPNLQGNCPSQACNGKEYGEFLVGTSRAIHNAQRAIYSDTAKVLFGGLYQERWSNPITNYLRAAGLASGIKSAYDGLSLHPYALGRAGDAPKSYTDKANGVKENIEGAYRDQLNGIGVSKPLWITEIGWPLAGDDKQHVTPADQERLLNETFNWIKQHWETYDIKYVAWFEYQDVGFNPSSWDQNCGLRDLGGGFRPAWFAYQAQAGMPPWPTPPPLLNGVKLYNTSSRKVELHPLNGATGYQTFLGQASTALDQTFTPDQWQFSAFDANGDQATDLIAVKLYNTGSGKVEVHMLNGATGYQTFLLHQATALDQTFTPDQWQFSVQDANSDNVLDLVGVKLYNTGSGKIEVHMLNGATGNQVFMLHQATALDQTFTPDEWQFSMLDVNSDKALDLVGVKLYNTGSRKIEVHIANGATGYQTFLLHQATALEQTFTPDQWQFSVLLDANDDKALDLAGVKLYDTGSGRIEVHILNGAMSYQTFLVQQATVLGQTFTPDEWQFSMGN
jgi:hypothetical protein